MTSIRILAPSHFDMLIFEVFTKRKSPDIVVLDESRSMKRENSENRNKNLLEMIRRLLLAEVAFQGIFEKHKKRKLHFADIGNWIDDKGQSLLYNLKEQSHSFFRGRGREPVHRNEWLLDLAIGSIFHEAMKLRENIYQMEVYRPRYLQFKSKVGKTAYAYERDYLQRFERIISRGRAGAWSTPGYLVLSVLSPKRKSELILMHLSSV